MASSCSTEPSACGDKQKFDWLLWGSLAVAATAYLGDGYAAGTAWGALLAPFTGAVAALINTIWWGLVIGMVMVGLLAKVPREFIVGILGARGAGGIVKATLAGFLMDLCSHGVLMIGAKLYERGASVGQVMAFLIASPWNSFSLTIILVTLIGLGWTAVFIVLSLIIGIVTGLMFERLEARGFIPTNQRTLDVPQDFQFWRQAKIALSATRVTPTWLGAIITDGIRDSRVVVRWVLFGVILAALLRTLLSADDFATYFGPTLLGLGATLLTATVIEICSEGSAPLAADLLNRAKAPGNGFAFLMAGVATDYTEVMVMKNTTRSWRIALLLPALTVPQIVVLAWLMNQWQMV